MLQRFFRRASYSKTTTPSPMSMVSSLKKTISKFGYAPTVETRLDKRRTSYSGRCGDCSRAFDIDCFHFDCEDSEWDPEVLTTESGALVRALDHDLLSLSMSAIWELSDDKTNAWVEICAVVESFITDELGLVLCPEGSHVDFDRQCIYCKAVK